MSRLHDFAGTELFPLPIAAGADTVERHGHCAWFCSSQRDFVLPQGKSGNTITEHGGDPWCDGQVSQTVRGEGPEGSTYVAVSLISAYMHGEYPRGQHGLIGPHVALLLSGPNDHGDQGAVIVDSGQARSLAAALNRAADLIEGLASKEVSA